MRVVADGAVGHGGKHDGNLQLKLRAEVVFDAAFIVAIHPLRLFAEKGLRFHRLAQRVNGRVCHLGGVDEHFVPVDWVFLRVAHGGQQHAARARLAVNLADGVLRPVFVFLKGVVRLDYFQRPCRTQRDAAVADDAFRFVREHHTKLFIVMVHVVCALPFAHAAGYAPCMVAHNLIFGV